MYILMVDMEDDEKIQAHLMSVWKEGKSFMTIHGTEGMLILTDKHLMFISKTQAKMKWWGAATQRQVITLTRSKNTMIIHDGYNEENLKIDLENKKNSEYGFDDIIEIKAEEKEWGSALLLDLMVDGKKKTFQFSIVQDWVKYPVKSPMKYMKVDWEPIVKYIVNRQKFTK